MIVITRRQLVFALGALIGFFWLLPVYGPPQGPYFAAERFPILRAARLLVPPLVFLAVPRRVYARGLEYFIRLLPAGRISLPLVRLLLVSIVLAFIPLLAAMVSGSVNYFVITIVPLVISTGTLVGIALLDDETLQSWVAGIGFLAACLLTAGILITHGALDPYYGRPRALYGFYHPIYTASAILATCASIGIWFKTAAARRLRYRKWVMGGAITLFAALLVLAQSRNLILAIAVGGFCRVVALRRSRWTRSIVVTCLLLLPMTLYGFVLFGSSQDWLWKTVDTLSDQRLQAYQLLLSGSTGMSSGGNFLGPSDTRMQNLDDLVGFAATDSVYLSFLSNYGVLSFALFNIMLLCIGWRLSRTRLLAGPYGAACATIVFFALDAQGITTSNLAVFVAFAYAVRAAIRPLPTPQGPLPISGAL